MAKAAEKRAEAVQATARKASAENAKAARVVAAQRAMADGTAVGVAEAKAQMYEKLLNAEVTRLHALKAKYCKAGTVEVIVVKIDGLKIRKPPPALALRLT